YPWPASQTSQGSRSPAACRRHRHGYVGGPMGNAWESQITLTINGQPRVISVDNRTSLLDLLRERLGLTGTKKGCDHGQCGACTVLIGGRRANACLALAVAHDGAEITTVEGLADDGASRTRCRRRSLR